LYGNVYEGLVQFAADGSVVPLLAESWDVSDEGTVYTFHLRHGVRFHDGRPSMRRPRSFRWSEGWRRTR
jgi:peptide/nickel transport system substrate-binding protein